MWQVLFTLPILGGIKLFGYGLMLFLAFVASTNLAARQARREHLDPDVIYDLSLFLFLGGLIGARLFYVIQYWGVRVHTLWDIAKIWEGGIVLYGSIIGGASAFFLYRLARPFPIRPFMDVVAPSLALGVAIGRIGCFLNGCCYGDICHLPWSVSFPEPSPPWQAHQAAHLLAAGAHWSLPVHPTQIYSAIDGLILMALLLAYFPLRRRDGEVIALLMVTYPITRFLIEYLRSDEKVFLAGMTISQNISVGLMAFGLFYWAYLSRLPRGRLADRAAPAESQVAAVAG